MKRLLYEECNCHEGDRYNVTFNEWLECLECDYNMTDKEIAEEGFSDHYDGLEAQLKGN